MDEDHIPHRTTPITGWMLLDARPSRTGKPVGMDHIGADLGVVGKSHIILRRTLSLPTKAREPHAPWMFIVTEADAAAIRAALEQAGELSAALEVRRRFPGITDSAHARSCARSIAGWEPLPATPCTVTRLRPGKRG